MTMKINVMSCARCGGDHKDLVFHKMQKPIILTVGDSSQSYSWWGFCSVKLEPIILEVSWDTLPTPH